ncbi:OmpA family protein [Croceitalea rosinachiae]|uniref:OmpA family protein n=1 Tax=Croceitalea rosinachiae TaxID=3075596 RepID=A0ABU3AGQ1_9FLAO|nr:OmpA family protein [Croceitalea sp. F388]MDT0608071.1 OmpA family protein [Croceitalea sp. F388]
MRVVLKFILFIFFISVGEAYGQNLVKNPSFEDFEKCPNSLGTFNEDLTYWSTPTNGTTDYFNTCSKVMGAPENFNGIQQPKYGNAYAGLYFYAPADYREYIQAPLKRMLRKGEIYTLSFYVSLAEGSDFAVKDFGVVMSYKPLGIPTKKELSRGRLYRTERNQFQTIEINHPEFHEDKTDWLKVTASFEAKGFESYLILGNLRKNATTRIVQTKRKETKKGAYYYIDMVSLTKKDDGESMEHEVQSDLLIVFKNVHFDFDHFTLTKMAKSELDAIKLKMQDIPELRIEIHGHTDNFGNQAYNKALSEKRAKTIAMYLIKSGIEANRVSWFGHGSSKPLFDNLNGEERAQNRRAEFLFKSE